MAVVFSTITSVVKDNPYVTRIRYTTNTGFQVKLQAEEKDKKLKISDVEEISWVSWGLTKEKGF